MPRNKLNRDGQFLPFPGYSVISKVLSEQAHIWDEIYQLISDNALAQDNYALLPKESWHMTGLNLFTQEDVEKAGKNWESYTHRAQNWLDRLNELFKATEFSPCVSYMAMRVDGAIQILLTLDENTKEKLEAIATEFKLNSCVPRIFHVTLAYQYKPLDQESLEQLRTALQPQIRSLFEANLIQVNPPRVHYFDDMTCFTALDELESDTDGAHEPGPGASSSS